MVLCTLKMVSIGSCGTFNRVMWYFEEGGVVLSMGLCGTLKRVVRYFEEEGVTKVII